MTQNDPRIDRPPSPQSVQVSLGGTLEDITESGPANLDPPVVLSGHGKKAPHSQGKKLMPRRRAQKTIHGLFEGICKTSERIRAGVKGPIDRRAQRQVARQAAKIQQPGSDGNDLTQIGIVNKNNLLVVHRI